MADIKDYTHAVQYYETDRMGITHHSNYIRWMEEARINFLAQAGWSYAKLEEIGIISPVVSVSCEYKHPTTFPDEVVIRAYITEFRGVTLKIAYEMKNKDGVTVCVASSSHAFLNAEGRPIRMKREFPALYETLTQLVTETE